MQKKKLLATITLITSALLLSSCGCLTGNRQSETITPLKHKVIASNGGNVMAIKSDGSVVHTPIIHTAGDIGTEEILDWENIIEVDCGGNIGGNYSAMGLKADGTVVGWGKYFEEPSYRAELGIEKWDNIISISLDNTSSAIGLKDDNTVIVAPIKLNNYVSHWKDIIAITSGEDGTCFLGVRYDGRVVTGGPREEFYNANECNKWRNIISADMGASHIIGLAYDGTVQATGNNDYGQCNVSEWENIVAISASYNNTIGLKNDGTVVAVGDNEYGQCNVSNWKDIIAIETDGHQTIGLKKNGSIVIAGFETDAAKLAKKWKDIKVTE